MVKENTVQYSMPEDAYAQAFAALKDTKWIHETPQPVETLAAFKNINEAIELEVLESRKEKMIDTLQEMISTADPEAKVKLIAVLSELRNAKSAGAINNALQRAAGENSNAANGEKASAGETPEQAQKRIWNEISALEKDINDGLHDAHARGYLSNADIKAIDERQAKLDLQKAEVEDLRAALEEEKDPAKRALIAEQLQEKQKKLAEETIENAKLNEAYYRQAAEAAMRDNHPELAQRYLDQIEKTDKVQENVNKIEDLRSSRAALTGVNQNLAENIMKESSVQDLLSGYDNKSSSDQVLKVNSKTDEDAKPSLASLLEGFEASQNIVLSKGETENLSPGPVKSVIKQTASERSI